MTGGSYLHYLPEGLSTLWTGGSQYIIDRRVVSVYNVIGVIVCTIFVTYVVIVICVYVDLMYLY